MSLPFSKDKMLTENPFIDLLMHDIKVLGYSAVIKDQYTADKMESMESLKESAIYIACMENHAELGLFKDIPESIMVKAGVPQLVIDNYKLHGNDLNQVPDMYHADLVKELTPWYIKQYQEKNEYYRMITGLPPVGDPGIPMRDYEYLIPEDITYTGIFLHDVGAGVCQSLEAAGVLEVVRADYPQMKYLNYLTQGITLYDARNKVDFQILWLPSDLNSSVTEKFRLKYAENRKFMLSTVYSSAMEVESEYYHNFMIAYTILITMIDMIVEVQSHIIRKDVLDRRCIEYIFSMYGVPYYKVIPYKYQERMCKNIYSLLKYKSCNKEMLDLIKIFGFEDLRVFKWNLLKVRKTDQWGDFIYSSSKQYYCQKNTIIDHQKVVEKISDKFPRGKVPNDIHTTAQYYPGSGIANDYNPPTEHITSDGKTVGNNTGSHVTENIDPSAQTPDYQLRPDERFIPFPFEYFLQKGNVMFVRFRDYVLKPGVDYTIHSYNIIRFLNGINQSDYDKIQYDFYYDNTTPNSDFPVDKDHCVQTIQQKLTYNGTNRYSLKPVPIDRYFEQRNQVIVTLNTTWLPPDAYIIDYDDYEIEFDKDVVLDENSDITLIYVYSKHLKSRYSKATVKLEQDKQDKVYIPEPFPCYALNGNTFYITLGQTFIDKSRYKVTPSRKEGQAYIEFLDKEILVKGQRVVFNFLYSSNSIYDPLIVEEKVVTLTATKRYQYEFDMEFPVDHYVECGYKVFVKMLGSWLPSKFFDIVGKNKFVLKKRSLALQPGREIEVHLVYMPADRTVKLNLEVAYDAVIADKENQIYYPIKFPTSNYFTRGNKLIVDVDGRPLEQKVDYEVSEKSGKIKITNKLVRPKKGGKVNYTFYYNKEAEYYLAIDAKEVEVEKVINQDFSIPWPFFPYLESGQDFLVVVGTTIVPKSRIVMTTRFNFRILGLDPAAIGRKVTILFIYNSWYTDEKTADLARPRLIVEWRPHDVYKDSIDINTPFKKYIENDWDYFVTYNNRLYMEEGRYDVYNSTFYTHPVPDLMNKVYGDIITFVFVYLKRKPWVFESDSEEYEDTTDLKFSKAPIEDIHAVQYMKDPSNWKAYDPITIADGWWDGLDYKENSHQIIKDAIYEQKFNYARSKYFGISNTVDLGEYTAQMAYFYSMLYDDVLIEKNVKLFVPSLSPSHQFNIAHLFVYMTSLTYIFNGLEDFVLDTPTKFLYVSGFNFKTDLERLKEYIESLHHDPDKEFPIWNFISPKTQIPDFSEFINVYKTNYAVRKTILKGMVESNHYIEYSVWKLLYDSLLRWNLNMKFFTLDNGSVAKTYTEFLKEKEPLLYQSIQDIKKISDEDERQDKIIQVCDDIIYIMEKYMKGKEFKYVFDRFPGHAASHAAKYLHMMIDFFKSYKVTLLPRTETLNMGGDAGDPNNYAKPIDGIWTNAQGLKKDYFPLVEIPLTTEHINVSEYGKFKDEDHRFVDFKDISGIEDATSVFESSQWMLEALDIRSGTDKMRVTLEFPCSLEVKKLAFSEDIITVDSSDMEYTIGEDIEEFEGLAVIKRDKFEKELPSTVTMHDYFKMAMSFDAAVKLDGRIFLAGYKMMDIYRPIYDTMTAIPTTDRDDINDRFIRRYPNKNLEEAFKNCNELTSMDLEFDIFDAGGMLKYTNIKDLFMNCYHLHTVNFPMQYVPDSDHDKHLERIFYACRELHRIDNFQISMYDTTKGPLHLEEAFSGCTNLQNGPTYIRSTDDMHMNKAFYGCAALREMPRIDSLYGNMDMSESFAMCKSITTLGPIFFSISNKPGKNVKINMRRMFYDCVNLTDVSSNGAISISLADVDMTKAFEGCIKLENTPVFEIKSRGKLDLTETYIGCKNLKIANRIFGEGEAEIIMNGTYKDCRNLHTTFQVDIDGSASITMHNTFEGCTSLRTIYDLFKKSEPGKDVAYYLKETFKGCKSLTNLVIDASSIYSVDGIFTGCTGLRSVTFVNPNSVIESQLTHNILDGNTLFYRIFIHNA